MLLAHEIQGDGPRALALAHGILGSGHNLRGLARRLVERLPGWRAITLDLRNHGASHGAEPPHTITACAGDVAEVFAVTGAPEVVLGHSFGAKVMLAYALAATGSLRQVWLLDAPLGARDRAHDSEGAQQLAEVMETIASVPLPVASRAALVDALKARGLSAAICQWMTTNLREVRGGYAWRFDLSAIREMVDSFWQTDLWPVLDALAPRVRVTLVRAGRGGRFAEPERARIAAAVAHGRLEEIVIPHVGHWLHTEDPEALLALLVPRMAALVAEPAL